MDSFTEQVEKWRVESINNIFVWKSLDEIRFIRYLGYDLKSKRMLVCRIPHVIHSIDDVGYNYVGVDLNFINDHPIPDGGMNGIFSVPVKYASLFCIPCDRLIHINFQDKIYEPMEDLNKKYKIYNPII